MIRKMLVVSTNDTDLHVGTSLTGYIDAKYDDLVAKFGEPGCGDGYKVDAEWTVIVVIPPAEFSFDQRVAGEVFVITIYNYKDGPNYDDDDRDFSDALQGFSERVYTDIKLKDTGWHIGSHAGIRDTVATGIIKHILNSEVSVATGAVVMTLPSA